MKKTTSTILKEQDDGIEVEEEKLGNKSPLFDRKIEIATEVASMFLKNTLSQITI